MKLYTLFQIKDKLGLFPLERSTGYTEMEKLLVRPRTRQVSAPGPLGVIDSTHLVRGMEQTRGGDGLSGTAVAWSHVTDSGHAA